MATEEYSKKLEEHATNVYLENRSKVSNFLENRSIRNILHFTHTLNLISILTNGLKSLEMIDKAGITNKLHDMWRSDEIKQGIFCSIAYPNIWMLNGKPNLNPQEYAILEIMENSCITITQGNLNLDEYNDLLLVYKKMAKTQLQIL